MTTASVVRTARVLCSAESLEGDLGHRDRDLLDRLEHAVLGRVGQLADDLAVGEEDDAVRVGGGVGVVGDHDGRLVALVGGAAQQREDLVGDFESRLPVGSSAKTTAGSVIERAGDRDALLLAARELGRLVRAAVGQADLRRAAHSRLPFGLLTRERQRQHDVLLRRQLRDQVERLEDEADALAAEQRQLLVLHRRDVRRPRCRRCRRSAGRGPRAGA